MRSATCAEAPNSLLQAVVNVVDGSPAGEEWESLMKAVDQFVYLRPHGAKYVARATSSE